jgi:hypothetical protein
MKNGAAISKRIPETSSFDILNTVAKDLHEVKLSP